MHGWQKCLHPCLPSHSFPKSVGFSICIWCFFEASIPFCPSFGKSFLQNGLVAEGWITRCLDLKMQTPVHLIHVVLSSHCSFFPLTVNFKAVIQGIATQKAASRLLGMCMAEITLILQKHFLRQTKHFSVKGLSKKKGDKNPNKLFLEKQLLKCLLQ